MTETNVQRLLVVGSLSVLAGLVSSGFPESAHAADCEFDQKAEPADLVAEGVRYLNRCRQNGGDPAHADCVCALSVFSGAGGNQLAQFNLGLMYANGWGVAQDDEQATEYFEAAADGGLPEAQYNYGYILFNGLGVKERNPELAHEYFLKAAKGGLEQAQYTLGVQYLRGEGVDEDFLEAYVWLNVAARSGYDPQSHYRSLLTGQLTATERLLGEERVEALLDSPGARDGR